MYDLGNGYTAKVKHIRLQEILPRQFRLDGPPPRVVTAPRGGCTVITVLDAEKNAVALGAAFCNPKENYNKRMGRRIAFGRAIKAAREAGYEVVEP